MKDKDILNPLQMTREYLQSKKEILRRRGLQDHMSSDYPQETNFEKCMYPYGQTRRIKLPGK